MEQSEALFIVRVADPASKREAELRVHASDQDAAMASAEKQGWIALSASPAPAFRKRPQDLSREGHALWRRNRMAEPNALRMLGIGHVAAAVLVAVIGNGDGMMLLALGLWVTGAVFYAAGSCARSIIAAILGPEQQ